MKQMQLLLHHKDHTTVRDWLKELLIKNYVGKIDEKRYPGDNQPAIYYLEKNGLLFLKDQPNIEKSYLEKMRSEGEKKQQFFEKCLFITNTYLHLSKQSESDGFTLKFYTQNDFSKKAKIQQLKPSFAYVKEENNKIEQYSCEFIHAKMPERALQGRIDSYLEYFSDGETNSPMHVIFICQNGRKFTQAKKYLKDVMDEYIKNVDVQVIDYDDVKDGNIQKIEIANL